MDLYIRHKDKAWITFVHDVSEFKELVENYIPGKRLLIGDVSQFNKTMLNMCLKFCEDNPDIDLYSSEDINSPILLSRFVRVFKDPLSINEGNSVDKFVESDRGYVSAVTYLSRLSTNNKLRVPLISQNVLKIMLGL